MEQQELGEVSKISEEQAKRNQGLTDLCDVIHARTPNVLVVADYRKGEVNIFPYRKQGMNAETSPATDPTVDNVEENWKYDRGLVEWQAKAYAQREARTPDAIQGFLVSDYRSGKVYEVPEGSLSFKDTSPAIFQPLGKTPQLHPQLELDLHKYGGRANPQRPGVGYRRGRAERWRAAFLSKEITRYTTQITQAGAAK